MKREDIHWLDEENSQLEEETITEEKQQEPAKKRPSVSKPLPKRTWLFILVILCITCIGAFLLSDTFYSMVHHQTTYTLKASDVSLEYTSDGVTHVHSFKNLLLRINRNGVQAVDTKGAVHWDVPYSMNGPSFSQAGSYAAIADLKGNQICLLNESGQIGNITTEGPITYCTVNETGHTAVIISTDVSNRILVYDKSGNILVRRETYISQDGIPIAATLNADGTSLATSYVIYTETDLRSAVTLFNISDSSQTADKIAGNYSYPNTLVTELHYMDDMLMYIGDNRIGGIRTTGNTEQLWEESLAYQIVSFDFGSDYLAVLFGNGMAGVSIGADSNLIVYAPNGSRLLEMNIESPESLNVSNDIIVYQDGITYNAMNAEGVKKWFFTPSNAPQQLFAMDSKHAVSVTPNSIDFMNVVGLDETLDQ